MAVIVKNATKGAIFSYSDNRSGLKYRVLNLEEHYGKKPFDIKLLDHKGVDIVTSGKPFVSDIVFPENQNKEVLTPEFYNIEKNVNAYRNKLKQLSEEYRRHYTYYGKEPLKTVDYNDQTYFALTYKMRGFTDLHSEPFGDDHKNIDGVTAYSIFLTLKAKQEGLEDYWECEEEEEVEEEESEYEPGDEVRSDVSEDEEDTDNSNEVDGEDIDNSNEVEVIKNKRNLEKVKDKTNDEKISGEAKDKTKSPEVKEENNSKKQHIDDDKNKNEDDKQSNAEDEYRDDSEEWESAEEEIDWDSEDELNLILYKDNHDKTNENDKAWMYHYFGRDYSPHNKWEKAFRDDKAFCLSTRNRYSSYSSSDSYYWDSIPEYLENTKKPKGLKPCHIKAFKDIDFNCIYIEHESITPESIEIRERVLPEICTKQSKVFDLYDKGAEKPYGTLIKISFSPPLTEYNYHSDEGFYNAGVNFYSNDQGIVLTGEQNIPTMFYGMALYEGVIIPDVFYDTP